MSKLGLGCVQFGSSYGVSTEYGQTTVEEARRILAFAARHGIGVLDTASSYGTSEQVIGEALPVDSSFQIVTKTPVFNRAGVTAAEVAALEQGFAHSLAKLRQARLYGLLVHSVGDLLADNGASIYAKMLELKERGLVSKIGVSVYEAAEIDAVLAAVPVDLVQLPINILDQRLLLSGHLQKLKQKGIEVHARSVFAQGLLLMDPETLPSHLQFARGHIEGFRRRAAEMAMSPLQAALAFVSSLKEIDVVLFGVNNCEQLREISSLDLSCRADFSEFMTDEARLLDPRTWEVAQDRGKPESGSGMVLAILQARVSSTRLPGKVLKPIQGKPMLARQIERILRCRKIDKLVVATSQDPSDDAVEQLCAELGVACFRGSLNDVLDRFYQAARSIAPDYVVRLTGDCPLAEPELIDGVIEFALVGDYDYASNCLEFSFPDGLDVEVFRFTCLEQAHREARLPSAREHVTPFIWRRPERFRIGAYKSDIDLSYLRWTVDEREDFELVSRIYEALYPTNPHFNRYDILALLEREPQLQTINACYARNTGLRKSLRQDEEFVNRNK